MKDDLPKDPVDKDEEDVPAKVSFHSLKDEKPEEPEKSEEVEEAEEPEKSLFDLTTKEEPPLKKEIDDDGDHLDNEDSDEDEESVKEDEEEVEDDPEPAESANSAEPEQYYLQTVKVGEQPEWPRPKEDLDVFSQPLDGGLIQYWAYPKELNKSADDFPHAEELAQKNQSGNASIVIDQICDHLTPGSCLELVLTKNGHALAKTESNLNNLEANITSLLEMSRQNFGITAEHFMSTSNVLPEVEKRLDDLEEAEGEHKVDETAGGKEYNVDQKNQSMEENQTPLYFNDRPSVVEGNKRSKWVALIPILIIILIFGGVVYYREKLLSKITNKVNPPKQETVEATPFPTPTPTPALSVERANFKVRVLNGTPTTGAAGVLADKLKAKGWLIDRTGNATSSAILESFVRIKPGVLDDAVKVLLLDIEDYQGASFSSPLKSTDKADLEFVIGKK